MKTAQQRFAAGRFAIVRGRTGRSTVFPRIKGPKG